MFEHLELSRYAQSKNPLNMINDVKFRCDAARRRHLPSQTVQLPNQGGNPPQLSFPH